MTERLRLRFFAHSWRSDWNHGNAHFLRGLVDELRKAGHEVRCYEQENAWSYVNLLQEESSEESLREFEATFCDLDLRVFPSDVESPGCGSFLETELRDADVVVVHEWNSPRLAQKILALRQRWGFRVLFHDTHHRSYTQPDQIGRFSISEFDGVLAFGEAIRQIYLDDFGAKRAWTFHEAADTERFYPRQGRQPTEVNWIGNWGDDERTRELQEFLIDPLATLKPADAAVYGVRYPEIAKRELRSAGIQYRGYLPNLSAPQVYSRCALTLHIPRQCYANGLSGIPTIRMFEALACAVPVICSPWNDLLGLFRANEDFLCVADGKAMTAQIAFLLQDHEARQQLSQNAVSTIRHRHTCAHRARQFEEICGELSR
jgi:spore maturation protein CgeB